MQFLDGDGFHSKIGFALPEEETRKVLIVTSNATHTIK
jgi:hypothetical protein